MTSTGGRGVSTVAKLPRYGRASVSPRPSIVSLCCLPLAFLASSPDCRSHRGAVPPIPQPIRETHRAEGSAEGVTCDAL